MENILNIKDLIKIMKETIDLLENPKKYIDKFKEEWLKHNMDFIKSSVKKEKREEFQKALLDHAIYRYYDLLEDFSYFSEPFKIYRAMTIKKFSKFFKYLKEGKNLKGYDGLGIYWTWDRFSATPIWAERGEGEDAEEIIITALVKKDEVNWWDTILKNTDESLGDEEKEIQLFEKSKIKIIEIEREKKKDITNLELKAIVKIGNLSKQVKIDSEIKLKSSRFWKRIYLITKPKEVKIKKFIEKIPSYNDLYEIIMKDPEILEKEGDSFNFTSNMYNDTKEDLILFVRNPILYRNMTIDDIDDFISRLKRKKISVGEHWTSDFFYALEHNEGEGQVILEVLIDPLSIDILNVFRYNIMFPEEKEYPLTRNQELRLKKIHLGDDNRIIEVDIHLKA